MTHLKKNSLFQICLLKLLIVGDYEDLQTLCIGPICNCRREIGEPANVFNITIYMEWFIDLCSLISQNRVLVSTSRSDRTGSMHVTHAGPDGISYVTLPHPPTSITKQPDL